MTNKTAQALSTFNLRQKDSIDRLTGKKATTDYPTSITPHGMGGKFSLDGKPMYFPGNTFLCHLRSGSDEANALAELQDGLRTGPFGNYFTYLPVSSFHMTIFEGVCGDPLKLNGWPEGVDENSDLASITDLFQSRLSDVTTFKKVSVVPEEFQDGYWLALIGETPSDREKLRYAREKLQALTGLYRSSFSNYRFHSSIGYLRKWMPEDQVLDHLAYSAELFRAFQDRVTRIDLGQVEFCTFESMHHFEPVQRI